MAKTYSAIQTQTVTGSAASSITFSNIPQNYTDLKFLISARSNYAAHRLYLQIALNGSTSITGMRALGYDGNQTLSGTGQTNQIAAVSGTSTGTYTFNNCEVTITNYSAATPHMISTDSAQEENSSTYDTVAMYTNYFSTSAAINTVTFTLDLGSFDVGSTFTLYGIGQGAKASGGTVSSDGKYMYHTFLSTGALVPTEQIKNAEVLLIAGGGGSTWRFGGGAGAGGVVYAPGNTFTAGTPYVATVGAGGTAGGTSVGGSGNNSQFSSLTVAVGGGYPGGSSTTNGNAANGGSGGGGGGNSGGNAGGTGISGQGNNGGNGATSVRNGGGGGGAGAAGENANNNHGGNGGVGTSAYSAWGAATNTGQNISGTYYYAGGGGGGANLGNGGSDGTWDGHGLGGYGGGGNGGAGNNGGGSQNLQTETAGTANTGGGAGGNEQSSGTGFTGGSGIVIVRYPITQ